MLNLQNKEVKGRIYAIGDIHGCNKELNALLSYLKDIEKITQEDQLIFVGDYIDRGPDSKGAIETLITLKKDFPETIFLRGNHEDMFLDFLGLGGNYGAWSLINGSKKVFEEYKLDYYTKIDKVTQEGEVIRTSKKNLGNMFPKEHMDFILGTEYIALVNNFIFVHAGLNPNKSIENQTTEDLFWIREDFLWKTHSFNKLIIHGHTISRDVYFNLPYEIGIDTGCFKHILRGYDGNGALSAIRLHQANPIDSLVFTVLSNTDKVILGNS